MSNYLSQTSYHICRLYCLERLPCDKTCSGNLQMTNLRTAEIIFVYNLTEIGTNENKAIYSIWHAYSPNDALSSDTKVYDLVTLTFSDFVTVIGIVFHKHIYFLCGKRVTLPRPILVSDCVRENHV